MTSHHKRGMKEKDGDHEMRKETLARRFNQNAALAIEDLLLLDTGERDELPAVRIAKFLHEAEGLDAARVGEFLCHDDQLSARVIQVLLTQKRDKLIPSQSLRNPIRGQENLLHGNHVSRFLHSILKATF